MSTEEPMSIEDRVRAATRAGATLVRDIGPLAAPDPVRLRRGPAPAARQWRSWGIPLAAAAAVVLVALSLVAVRQFGASAPSATTGPATTVPATVPRYYVSLDQEETSKAARPGPPGPSSSATTSPARRSPSSPRRTEWNSTECRAGPTTGRSSPLPPTRNAGADGHVVPAPHRPGNRSSLPADQAAYQAAGRQHCRPRLCAVTRRPGTGGRVGARCLAAAGDVITLAIYSVSSGAELRAWTTGEYRSSGLAKETLSWLSDGRQLAFSDVPPGLTTTPTRISCARST